MTITQDETWLFDPALTTEQAARQQVTAGAALLDAKGPGGWRKKLKEGILIRGLRMWDSSACVLGILYGGRVNDSYYTGAEALLGPPGPARTRQEVDNGFLPLNRRHASLLEAAWRAEIGA